MTGKVPMRESTRQRVLAAAKALGYRPNRFASALASGRYPAVALLIADITNLVNADLVKAVEKICTPREYTVTICHTDKDVERERAHLDDLLSNRVAGVIAKAEGAGPDAFRRLLDAGTKLVLLNNPVAGLDVPVVSFDRERGAREALTSLRAAGHQRIGVIVPDDRLSHGDNRGSGIITDRVMSAAMIERVADQLGITVQVEARPLGTLEDGREATLALLNSDRPPTAIYATAWLFTLGMLAVVNRLDVRQRERLGMVGTGLGEYFDAIAPWLSFVEIPALDQGRLATELLFGEIDGTPTPYGREVVLPLELVERRSTARSRGLRSA